MPSHVLITDNSTHKIVTENGFWGTKFDFAPTSYKNFLDICLKQPRKRYFSLIADILGTRII